jgi:hypothetical protein
MAGNQAPIFSKVAAMGYTPNGAMGTATSGSYGLVTDYVGTQTNNAIIFTADATNGGFVQRIRFKAVGTNAAAVARIYVNNGSATTTANNNYFYGEMSLPATTASSNSATPDLDYLMNFALPPGYKILVGISSASSLASGWVPTVIAGSY